MVRKSGHRFSEKTMRKERAWTIKPAGTGYHDAGTSGNWQTFGRRTPMRISGHLLGIVAAAFVALPVAASAQAKLDGRTVKIGCLAPLTGKGAEWGQAAKPSMEIAAEEINAKGGIGGLPIELICYDTQTLEAEALKAMSRLGGRA